MPVKIDPHIVEELADLDLVIWEARHPKLPKRDEKQSRYVAREDKGWVTVRLAGPGSGDHAVGGAATLREAVDAALRTFFPDRVKGLRGALMRLETAILNLNVDVHLARGKAEGRYEYDDDIPF